MFYSLLKLLIYKYILNINFRILQKLPFELKTSNFIFCKHTNKVNQYIFINSLKYNIHKKVTKPTLPSNIMYALVENNHRDLINNLKRRGIIDDDDVYDTMLQVC